MHVVRDAQKQTDVVFLCVTLDLLRLGIFDEEVRYARPCLIPSSISSENRYVLIMTQHYETVQRVLWDNR